MRIRGVLEIASLVVAPITLISALMFYFGWVRTNEFVKYFGIDQSLLGFSLHDYMLRSVDALYGPITILIVAALLALRLHSVVVNNLMSVTENNPAAGLVKRLKALYYILVVLGGFLIFIAVAPKINIRLPLPSFLVQSLGVAIGTAMLTYADWLRTTLRAVRENSPQVAITWSRSTSTLACMILIVLAIFSATEEYAGAIGRGEALGLAATLDSRRGVIVYSQQNLHIVGDGVRVQVLNDANPAYHYRYSNLRLLVHANHEYFLLPAAWSGADTDIMIVLPDNGDIRYEFTPGFD